MDRTTRGLLAGIIAGVAMNIWNLIDYYFLHFTTIRFLDWASLVTTWTKPENTFEIVFSLIIQIVIWDGFLGIIFAHLINLITSKIIVYKSVFYSAFCWFFFRAIADFYHIPEVFGKQPLSGRLSNFLGSILWGIILGLILKKFDKSPIYT